MTVPSPGSFPPAPTSPRYLTCEQWYEIFMSFPRNTVSLPRMWQKRREAPNRTRLGFISPKKPLLALNGITSYPDVPVSASH